jgi:hypothetical protein
MAKLPLYELLINEDEETGVDFISLVSSPAIEYDWVAFSAQKISIDYDDTLSTKRGQELASRLIAQGVDLYVISARNDKEGMLELTNKLGIDLNKVFATGSNKAKVEKVNELGITKHYDNNSDVVKALGTIGEQFVVEPKSGENKDEFISRCIAVEIGDGMEAEQAAAVCYTKWDKKSFSFKTTDKQIISGAAMIPDKPIYRRGKNGEEYNVVFSKETIQKIVERYFKNQYGTNFNLQHKKNMLADGVYLIESFIIDSERGIKTPEGFDELPDGSWFISCKVDNEEIWNDYIKSGKFKGFSVEGLFTDRRVEMVSNVQEAIDLIDKLQLNKTNIQII